MRNLIVLLLFIPLCGLAQDSTSVYTKRVLEATEVDFLMSYYTQDGDNAAVTGGIGTEKLTDLTPTIVISMPLNANDVLTVDAGISAYSSASSSNLDPFDASGASGTNEDGNPITGSPWITSTGASASDIWGNLSLGFSRTSENRNDIWSANASVSAEFDYFSVGFGGAYSKLFNERNTEIGIKAQVYLDTWIPAYPTELDSYLEVDGDLNSGFFQGVRFWDKNGLPTHPVGRNRWSPIEGFALIENKSRNTYAATLSFSQILSKNAQISFFIDIIQQEGWLANPTQRVYFGDIDNFFIGNPENVPNYTSPSNTDVFQVADDIERLPKTRFKTPIGMRFNYYVNEFLIIRSYYRYYFDNWGLTSHTASIELPIKITEKFTLYPTYRYYAQTAIDYFAPYEQNLSTQEFYTSDYDLSNFSANQYGLGIRYTDIFTKFKIFKLGLKSVDLRSIQYNRSTSLSSSIISVAFKFVFD